MTILNSNAYAENNKINNSINELRIDGFKIIKSTLENSTWHIFLEKNATYKVDSSGELNKISDIQFISCVFNDVKTVCYTP